MNKFQSALERQAGPFPMWIWAVILFAGLWFYRNKIAAPTSAASPVVVPQGSSIYDPRLVRTSTGQVQPIGMSTPVDYQALAQMETAQPPQTPVTLQPGESVYNPNSGNLLNTPGALLTVGTAGNQVAMQGGTSPNLSAAQTAAALSSGGNVTDAQIPTATQTGTPTPQPAHDPGQASAVASAIGVAAAMT